MPLAKPQHKPARDTRRVKEIQDLKSENDQLKRQLSRTRKKIFQLDSLIDQPVNYSRREEPETEPEVTCPACRSANLGSFTTPSGKVLNGCKDCGENWESHRRN